ncbi:MAG: hypothetical protein WCT32_03460 [Patescibacteria group bacterium]|jgi:hypothetical protein
MRPRTNSILALCAALMMACVSAAHAQKIAVEQQLARLEAEKSPSIAECAYTQFGCLTAAEEHAGMDPAKWAGAPGRQANFLGMYGRGRGDLGKIKEIVCAAGSVAEANETLRKAGFPDVQLQPAAGFATVAILKWQSEWTIKGAKTALKAENGESYDGVRMDAKAVKFYVAGDQVVAEIPVRNGDFVYITEAGATAKPLVESAKIHNALQPLADGGFTGLIFPKFEIRTRLDHTWMLGINNKDRHGEPVQIQQAVQEVRFSLDENGAKAESASAMQMGKGLSVSKTLTIDGPALAWVYRPGLRYQIVAGWANYDSWSKPGSTMTASADARDRGVRPQIEILDDISTRFGSNIWDEPAQVFQMYVETEKTRIFSLSVHQMSDTCFLYGVGSPNELRGKPLNRYVAGNGNDFNRFTAEWPEFDAIYREVIAALAAQKLPDFRRWKPEVVRNAFDAIFDNEKDCAAWLERAEYDVNRANPGVQFVSTPIERFKAKPVNGYASYRLEQKGRRPKLVLITTLEPYVQFDPGK